MIKCSFYELTMKGSNGMKLGIMQPYFFPYLGYWQLINAVDKYVIYDDVNYIKGGWVNRNRILMSGEPQWLSLKMNGASQNKLISDVKVANDKIYNKKLLKKIEHCYKKAPYFNRVYPIIYEIIDFNGELLSLYLENLIKRIASYLEIQTEFIMSSDIDKNNSLKGQDKIIEICKVLNASEYINASGGINLYTAEAFESNGIKLKILETGLIEYKQFEKIFEPNLSIIDVMMFNSKDEIKNMLNKYTINSHI